MKVTYEKHEGKFFPKTNSVSFYGRDFDTMSDAVQVLKQLTPGETYFVWYYNYHIGFLHEQSGKILIEGRWLPNEDFAEKYIDTKKK